MVEKNHPQWELVIVGDGTERPLVEEAVRKHNLQRVRLIGKTPDVSEYYKDSRIFVFTSAFEGFGLVLIEGLCFGLPEVSFDCPCGPDEIIEDGKNGFVIKDFNKALFAQKLAELMENERMQEEFSHRSKELSRKYLPENASLKGRGESFPEEHRETPPERKARRLLQDGTAEEGGKGLSGSL